MKNLVFALKEFIVLAGLLLFLSGCVSSTMIKSNPSGAKVYIDGQAVGVTPYLYSDTKILGSVTNIDILKEGYEPFYSSLSRTERVCPEAIVGGVFFGFPFLWSLSYNPMHTFDLVPLPRAEGSKSTNSNPSLVTKKTQEKDVNSRAFLDKVYQLRELKKLLDENIISNDEFQKEKQKILDEE